MTTGAFNLSRPIHKIYSPASLTKGILDEMGVPDWMARHGEAVQEALGPAMMAFYGARSEVMHRLAPVEVLYLDFHAQYPSVISLLQLQRFLLADSITLRRGPTVMQRVRDMLTPEATLLQRLINREMWKDMSILCLVRPNGDRLPYRSYFETSANGTANIADCFVYPGPQPSWWSLLDVAASVIRTGKIPEILDAIELEPHGQVRTRPYTLYDDERFKVDLAEDDLAVKLVEMRTQAKREAEAFPEGSPDRLPLEGVARVAKIIVNALYGIMVEIVAHARTTKARPVTRHGLEIEQAWTRTPETEGRRFAAPVGVHITAAGRLLLAMAEQLGLNREIKHAAADTDSMTYMRPPGMERGEFRRRVLAIQAAFEHLNPFSDGTHFFELEDRNYALEFGQGPVNGAGEWSTTDQLEPLYYIGVCPKRGVYYNLPSEGQPRIRAYSMHGIVLSNPELIDGELEGQETETPVDEESLEGMERMLAGYRSAADIPEPAGDVGKMAGGVGKRYVYDLYYRFIQRVRSGILSDRDVVLDELIQDGSLDVPALRQVTVTGPNLARHFGKHIALRPFSFFSQAASFTRPMLYRRGTPDWDQMAARATEEIEVSETDLDISGVTLYAPTCRTTGELLSKLRRVDTGQRVLMLPPTIREVMRDYFCRPNYKMADPYSIGEMKRRHVQSSDLIYVGKESNRLLAEQEGYDETVLITTELGQPQVGPQMQRWNLDELAWAISEINPKRLRRYRDGKHEPNEEHRALIVAGLVKLESGERPPNWLEIKCRLERRGVESVAECLGMKHCDLRRYLTGKRIPRQKMVWRIAAALDELDGTGQKATMQSRWKMCWSY